MTGLFTSEHSRLGEGWGWSRGGGQQAGDPHPNVLGAGPCNACRSTWLPEKTHPMLSTTPHKRVCVRAGQGLPSPPAKPGRPRRERALSSSLCWGLPLHSAPSHSHPRPFAGSRLAL